MKQLTIRGLDGGELERRLRGLARREGISLNQAALRLMRKGAGIEEPPVGADAVGDALDGFIGSWSDEEAAEFMSAVAQFDRVDPELWP